MENGRLLVDKLKAYKRKYYLNQMVKGTLLTLSFLLAAYLLFNTLEYNLHLNSTLRGVLFYSFIVLSVYSLIRFILLPGLKIFFDRSRISNEDAAKQIGNYFPEIKDKLLNTLQLSQLSDHQNSLISASLEQRTLEISTFSFTTAIHLEENRKYFRYILPSILIVLILLTTLPGFFIEGTERIINYKTDFKALPPFKFEITNESLIAFKNEDFLISAKLSGNAIPENTYININGRRIKMSSETLGAFSYPIRKVQSDLTFSLDASGYNSEQFTLTVVNRPSLKSFRVNLDYPSYTGKKDQQMNSAGNLLFPEGTKVSWQFESLFTSSIELKFSQENETFLLQDVDNELFTFEKRIVDSQNYEIRMNNEYSGNTSPIIYTLDVIKDSYPAINLNQFQDTTLYRFIILGGNISDDYGFTRLKLNYKSPSANVFSSINIPIDRAQASQSYYYRWSVDSLHLGEGEEVEYFVQVWDNDQINGAKSSRTGIYTLSIPSDEVMAEKLAKESQSAKNQIDKTLEKAKQLKEEIDETEKRLKEKRDLNWQDEKSLEDILEKRKELEEDIEKLKQQNKDLLEKQDRFHEPNKSIQQKAEQLQELMEELLDEETRKLYEELQRLLDENMDMNDVQDLMDQLKKNESNLEKELERTLELFKKLQVENKLDELVDKVEELAEEQNELSEKTGDKKESLEQIQEDQEKLNESFKEVKKMKEDLEKLNQELESPEPMQDTSDEEKNIDEEQKESSESLQNNKRKPAQKSQKKAAEKMKQLSEKLQQMQQGMEMQALNENLDQLREIVDNLIKLSKDQENLMNEFENVNQNDPRFIQLSQNQLKLKDDAKVIEDSLLALANRVFQIQSFVTREVAGMNDNMDEAVKAIRDREQARAVGKQHFAMTSMNNLALLLDDVLQQMQEQMADAMGNPSKGSGKQEMPSLSELQKQLNQKIQDIKKSGKTGRALSEELAKMAAEQERLRQMLQEMEKLGDGEKGKDAGGNQIGEKMEETELDLVNKKITRETIQRQEDILTRLLEFENAMRERELDEKRKGETAKEYPKEIPKEFEEYFKAKEKEVELLKTVPPKLNPYYKKEVNEYFKRISNQ